MGGNKCSYYLYFQVIQVIIHSSFNKNDAVDELTYELLGSVQCGEGAIYACRKKRQ